MTEQEYRDLSTKVFLAMTEQEYRALKIPSVSTLKMLVDDSKTPAHVYKALTEKSEPTPAMRLGTAVHMAILEESDYLRYAYVLPYDKYTTKAAKEMRDMAIEEGRVPLLEKEAADIDRYRKNIWANEKAAALLKKSMSERSIIWECEGVKIKSRLDMSFMENDILGDSYGVVSDVKTTTDASEDATNKAMFNYGYIVQAGAYCLAYQFETKAPCNDFYFLWIEKGTGFTACRRVSNEDIALGKRLFKHCCRRFKKLAASNNWHGYTQDTEQNLPEWARNKYLNILENE